MRKEIDSLQIGARIKEARMEAGMTQDHLAAVSGLSRAGVQKYEAGQPPKSLQLAALCQALNKSADYLLFGAAAEEPAAGLTSTEVDLDFLAEVMTGAFRVLDRKGIRLPAEKQTKLIFLLYEYCKLKFDRFDDQAVEQFLQVVG